MALAWQLKGSRFDSWCGHFGVAVVSLSKKNHTHITPGTQLLKWEFNSLVSTGEAANQAATSMDTC